MSDQPENLVLILLNRMAESAARFQRETLRRLRSIETRIDAVDGRLASIEEGTVEHGVRLDRIERRLDLTDATTH